MEIILKWVSPVIAVSSIYILWCEYKAHAPFLSLLKWLSGFIWGAGNCLAIYDLWPLGERIGGAGQLLFLLFAIADFSWRNFRQEK